MNEKIKCDAGKINLRYKSMAFASDIKNISFARADVHKLKKRE
jgi:hypothetical protein